MHVAATADAMVPNWPGGQWQSVKLVAPGSETEGGGHSVQLLAVEYEYELAEHCVQTDALAREKEPAEHGVIPVEAVGQ